MRCLTLDQCRQWRSDHCHRHAWKRQATCITPLDRLPWFTQTLVQLVQPFDHALLIIDEVVFDVPPALQALCATVGKPRPVGKATGLVFESDSEGFRAALEAALSGWIDLRALFHPTKHALRADHDEYTTFFSQSPARIAEFRHAMTQRGLKLVDWTAANP